jgi:hypothetical protein
VDGFDIGALLPSAGPAAILLVIIGVLLKVYISAERRVGVERDRVEVLTEQLDVERKKRWRAEDAAAKARRKAGDLDASPPEVDGRGDLDRE